MADHLTDADLIATLLYIEDHAGQGKAEIATALGIKASALRDRVQLAKVRGLTTASRVQTGEARLQAEVARLRAEVKALAREADTAEQLRQEIYGLSQRAPEPPVWLCGTHSPDTPGVPMVMWSDWHLGEVVSRAQVGGVNEFNKAIARRRVEDLVDTTIHLARGCMVNPDYPGIVVCLGGDIISGNIHDELRETNWGTTQQCLLEAQELLIAALKAIANDFGQVFVPCVVGNHGRGTLKPRAKNRVFDSLEWNLYCQLERYFRDDPRIIIHVPDETDAYFKVYNHRFLLTHGDALGVKGGDGIIGALGPIARGTFKVGRSEAQIGRDFDTLLMGHWHTYIPRGEAVPVIVNGALKGYDEYARVMLRVPYARPSQALWFVHPSYGVTVQWPVYLDKRRASANTARWLSFEQRRK